MNRRIEILVHVAIWLVMFLSPMMFINQGHGVTTVQFILMSAAPVTIMAVFYMNYLWLTPRYYVDGRHGLYFCINIIVIVALGVGLHFWMNYTHNLFSHMHHELELWSSLGFIVRNIFNLVVSAAISTAIVLAMRWQKAEQARKDAEAARTVAELSNLRSQINPHFLLNTLNNIYALTAFDAPKAQEAIQELSKMLRYILYNCQQTTVPLKDEVEFIENYVNLMRIRLPKTVDIDSHCSIHNSQLEVAPMIFISLVENAFKHGISPTEPSFIHINIGSDDHSVVCDISNSNYPKSKEDHSGHGIGLQQVQRRLDLSYPHQYQWQRSVSEDGKTYYSRIEINIK